MRIFLGLILILFSTFCFADVYMETEPNGGISYSDTPQSPKAIKIDNSVLNDITSESNTVTPPAQPKSDKDGNSSQSTVPANQPYTNFSISSPLNEDTIQNQPVINVVLNVQPFLQQGDTIQIFLDGSPWGAAMPNTQFELPTPDRGIHQISASLLDKNGQVLMRSGSNRIYVHQAHFGNAPPAVGGGI